MVKTAIEEENSIVINSLLTVTVMCNDLDNIKFIAAFKSLDENIFIWDGRNKNLIQKTFLIDNNITSHDISGKSGYILSLENNKKQVYSISEKRVNKFEVSEAIGNILYIYNSNKGDLILAIEKDNLVDLYLLKKGKYILIDSNIYNSIKPIYKRRK